MTIDLRSAGLAILLMFAGLMLAWPGSAGAHPLDEGFICDNTADLYTSPDPLAGGGVTGGMGGEGLGGAGVGPPPGCRPAGPQANEASGDVPPPSEEMIWATALRFVELGFTHIVPGGIDHVAFVLGLFLSSILLRPLLWQITAFTIAHSLTLALASLGVVNVPGYIIEPLIALTIVWVAVENVLFERPMRFRPAVVFCFGLAHGIGFAGAIAETGFPQAQFLTALVTFNVGVELGQLAVLLAAWAALHWFYRAPWYRARVVVPGSLFIALVAAYWAVTRISDSVFG